MHVTLGLVAQNYLSLGMQGIKLGVSSRGWASLRSDHRSNALIVEEDFDLITFDFVTDPSTQDAYLVPLREQYKGRLPDQSKAVLTAHLGHGTCSIEMVSNIPGAARLAQHIRALCSEVRAQAGAGLSSSCPDTHFEP